jgi:hypothetical protein
MQKTIPYDTTIKSIHILVALCDNTYQGIVPVPSAIGNGQDHKNNLYWGCKNGVSTYFKNSKNWSLVSTSTIDTIKLQRLVFKHKNSNYYLVCDAYNGKYIKDCTINFLNSCAGIYTDTIHTNNKTIGINGNAKLLAYIGHNGLMDFYINQSFNNVDNRQRDAVILACKSKNYFANFMQQTKANPLLWTSNLMCPEAYTLHDMLEVYIKKPIDVAAMHQSAAKAYATQQKCGLNAAKKLLVSGY